MRPRPALGLPLADAALVLSPLQPRARCWRSFARRLRPCGFARHRPASLRRLASLRRVPRLRGRRVDAAVGYRQPVIRTSNRHLVSFAFFSSSRLFRPSMGRSVQCSSFRVTRAVRDAGANQKASARHHRRTSAPVTRNNRQLNHVSRREAAQPAFGHANQRALDSDENRWIRVDD